MLRPVASAALLCGALGCRAGTPNSEATIASPPPAPRDGRDVVFPSPGRPDLTLTIFRPNASSKNLHRLVVLIHGGGWVSGGRRDMFDIARFFAAMGFTAASIDYTLAGPGNRWPAQLLDCQSAVRYLRAQAKELDIDPTKIGAAGISAGGHLSLWLGVSDAPLGGVSSRVQAVGSISGVLDLTKSLTPEGSTYRIVERLLTDDMKPTTAQQRDASPVFRLDQHPPPIFLIQGEKDPWVPASQSTDVEHRMKSLGRPVQLRMVPHMGHGLVVTMPDQARALREMADWLRSEL